MPVTTGMLTEFVYYMKHSESQQFLFAFKTNQTGQKAVFNMITVQSFPFKGYFSFFVLLVVSLSLDWRK